MIKSNYEVEVLVNGKPLKEYSHNERMYVEGREKTRFSIRMRNNTSTRKLFIPTIDGLSVMDGENANFNSSGYILQPNSTYTVDGWRINDNEVAEFFFSHPNESYRKRMKRGNNLGIIGVAVFGELEDFTPRIIKEYIIPIHNYHHRYWCYRCQRYHCDCEICPHPILWGLSPFSTTGDNLQFSNSSSVTVANVTATDTSVSQGKNPDQMHGQDLGTGWGDTRRSEVSTAIFERTETPEVIFEIYYNTRQQLEKLGIDFRKTVAYVTPQAFPGQYCKPPQD